MKEITPKNPKEAKEHLLKLASELNIGVTFTGMMSDKWYERLCAEMVQLAIRVVQLEKSERLAKDPLLQKQLKIMHEYLDVLVERTWHKKE